MTPVTGNTLHTPNYTAPEKELRASVIEEAVSDFVADIFSSTFTVEIDPISDLFMRAERLLEEKESSGQTCQSLSTLEKKTTLLIEEAAFLQSLHPSDDLEEFLSDADIFLKEIRDEKHDKKMAVTDALTLAEIELNELLDRADRLLDESFSLDVYASLQHDFQIAISRCVKIRKEADAFGLTSDALRTLSLEHHLYEAMQQINSFEVDTEITNLETIWERIITSCSDAKSGLKAVDLIKKQLKERQEFLQKNNFSAVEKKECPCPPPNLSKTIRALDALYNALDSFDRSLFKSVKNPTANVLSDFSLPEKVDLAKTALQKAENSAHLEVITEAENRLKALFPLFRITKDTILALTKKKTLSEEAKKALHSLIEKWQTIPEDSITEIVTNLKKRAPFLAFQEAEKGRIELADIDDALIKITEIETVLKESSVSLDTLESLTSEWAVEPYRKKIDGQIDELIAIADQLDPLRKKCFDKVHEKTLQTLNEKTKKFTTDAFLLIEKEQKASNSARELKKIHSELSCCITFAQNLIRDTEESIQNTIDAKMSRERTQKAMAEMRAKELHAIKSTTTIGRVQTAAPIIQKALEKKRKAFSSPEITPRQTKKTNAPAFTDEEIQRFREKAKLSIEEQRDSFREKKSAFMQKIKQSNQLHIQHAS